MSHKYFHIIVKKLRNYRGKIITNDHIKKRLKHILNEQYKDSKMYKTVYKLKNKGQLVNIKKNMYIAKAPSKDITEKEILRKYYREILKKHCREYVPWRWYVAWLKALELNMSNYSLPEDIIIVNKHKEWVETLAMDKKMTCKTYNHENTNLFRHFYKHTKNIKIGKYSLRIARIELALLESLYSPPQIMLGYTQELVKNVIRWHGEQLTIEIREDILKHNKHHSSINRLYQLSRYVDESVAQPIYEVIKKYSYLMSVNVT